MNKRKFALLLLAQFLLASALFAQKKEITGTVTDESGEPLSEVNVFADKQKSATVTKPDGSYRLQVDAGATTLIFSHVGFTTRTVEIGAQSVVNVSLQPLAQSMEEVIVIGYGTQKKSHLTGSVSKLKNERLDETPVSRLDQALQGKIAGVQIQNTTSEAGAAPRVRVRGMASINAGNDPLVVVDGHPVPDGLAFVNMADVESVEVLKDAASSAIYGSRGANGVIIVTTKTGKAEKPKYSVKLSTGTKAAYELHPLMSVSEYTNLMFYEASLRAQDPSISPTPASNVQKLTNQERAMYAIENGLLGGAGTDWQNEAVRHARVTNLQMNVSGGKKDMKYFVSGSYQKDQGLMYHSEYDKMSVRARLDANLGRKMKLNINLNPTYAKRERPSVNFIDFYRFYSFIPVRHTEATAAFVNQNAQWAAIRPGDWAQARHFNGLMYSGEMPDGSVWSSSSALNPWTTNNNTPKSIMETRTININEYRMLSSGDLTYNLLPGLNLKTSGSAYISTNELVDFTQRNSSKDGEVNRGLYSSQLFIDLLSENTANYEMKTGDHSFNALAGFTVQKSKTKNWQTVGVDFPSDNIRTLNNALLIDLPNTFSRVVPEGLLSYLGRMSYAYQNKYLISGSFRRDGSSMFAPGKKWGNFPSLSAGWVVSEESFMESLPSVSSLKLRGSYGVTGNNRIRPFGWVDLLYPVNYSFGNSVTPISSGQAPDPNVLGNPDITWERTFEYNFGLDLSLFRNKISLSAELYQSLTDQLLLEQATMSFTGVNRTWNNIGRLRNNGVELELNTINISTRNFQWKTSANIAHNRNKIVELGGEDFQLNYGERNEIYRAAVGSPSVMFFGYKTDGVWTSQAEADAAKDKDQGTMLSNYFTAGGLKLKDLNGDGKIDEDDRTSLGSPLPDFIWGVTNNVTFKSFDLGFMFQGVQGNEIVNGDAFYNESRKINRNFNNGNRWVSPMFPGDGKTPFFTNGTDWMLTDYVVEDGSYFALREIILGYTLPSKLAKSARVGSLRMYCSVQNAFVKTADGYRGINPEARYTSSAYASPLIDGYQRGGFPMPRTILFGIDVNF